MRRPLRAGRARWWVVALGALVAAAFAGSAGASAAPSPAGCDNRVNDTADKLIPCITTADLWAHMQAFQRIADANPGPDGHASRNSGEPGYKASVDYVAAKMRNAGFSVTVQTYKFDYFAFGSTTMSELSPTAKSFALNTDWIPGRSTGTVSGAQVKPAGGIVIRRRRRRAPRAAAPRPTSPGWPAGSRWSSAGRARSGRRSTTPRRPAPPA